GYLRTMEGVEVLVIFTEVAGGRVRVNFRSQGKMDVARIAAQFQGGGHHKASGCELSGTMGAVRRKVLAEMKKQVC
ncbi:MAG TPA: DHHA1 domain-containing protein, partial [Candidatus Bathyarchaeia archaeon]|nr:DHHA1 domain-containing protein [Candidatus Bathyarchaeia archaeon]